jgi:hypothetical protein
LTYDNAGDVEKLGGFRGYVQENELLEKENN